MFSNIPIEDAAQLWELAEGLLIQTLPTPSPTPQGSTADPTGSDLSEETEINIKLATLHLLEIVLNEYQQEITGMSKTMGCILLRTHL